MRAEKDEGEKGLQRLSKSFLDVLPVGADQGVELRLICLQLWYDTTHNPLLLHSIFFYSLVVTGLKTMPLVVPHHDDGLPLFLSAKYFIPETNITESSNER